MCEWINSMTIAAGVLLISLAVVVGIVAAIRRSSLGIPILLIIIWIVLTLVIHDTVMQ